MNVYPAANIRNVCLLGHSGDGKTSLAESLLFMTKATDRLGKVSDGNTVLDYDPEEIKRQISISLSVAPIEFEKNKINVIDTPGYFDFAGEVLQALRVADTAIIACTAKSGVGVGTEIAWKHVKKLTIPRAFYVSKLDEENADFYKTLDDLRDKFGISVCPVIIPIIADGKCTGVIDIISLKAYEMKNGASSETSVPDSMKAQVDDLRAKLAESVAETSEEFMEKYFTGEEFTADEFITGIKAGVRDCSIAPVFCGSAVTGLGTVELLRGIVSYAPSPLESNPETVEDSGKETELKPDENGPAVAIVFKTISDQYGKFSLFKVVSGKISSDMTLINPRTGQQEKMGHLYYVMGKKHIDTNEITLGDFGAVAKLSTTRTGDTLCASGSKFTLKGISFPAPTYSLAIAPKSKGGEEKISTGLARLAEEDLTFTIENSVETRQLIITGYGDIQIDVLCSKLKNRFGVEVTLEEPRVPYREKIRKKVKAQGKHKKQSGGHGQYGDVWIEFEPADQEDLVFEEKIVGGVVPRNYFPAVEKGLRECIIKGVLAGYPVVYLKATLVFGSYHDVDSSEMAFKIAASLAYKAGLPQADPVILEPIGSLKVFIPDSYMGDVIGDLQKRRGRVMGMNPAEDGLQIIEAEVPMAEMHTYTIDLRSMTQGRGSFEFKFERYEDVPMNIQQKIIEERKQFLSEEE